MTYNNHSNSFLERSLRARHCSKYFAWADLLILHSKSEREVLILTHLTDEEIETKEVVTHLRSKGSGP